MDRMPHGRLQLLLQALQANTTLRPLVRQVAGVFAHQRALLGHLHLFPNLADVSSLKLESHILPLAPANHVRPHLTSLTIHSAAPELDDLDEPTSVESWFDLIRLTDFRFYGCSEEGDLALLPLITSAPASLTHVLLRHLQLNVLQSALLALGRCSGLTLSLGPTYGSALANLPAFANPLVLFPALHILKVQYRGSLSYILGVPHGSLQELSVDLGRFDRRTGYPASHPLRQFVDNLCSVQRSSPPRYPALQVFGLAERNLLFARPAAREIPGVREMVRQLRSVGLRVNDVDGVE